MKQIKLELVIVEEASVGDVPQGSCSCFWDSRMDLILINDKFCVGCGRLLK